MTASTIVTFIFYLLIILLLIANTVVSRQNSVRAQQKVVQCLQISEDLQTNRSVDAICRVLEEMDDSDVDKVINWAKATLRIRQK